jgi:agmatine deiminase
MTPLRLLLVLLVFAAAASPRAQDAPWYDPDPLPQAMTDAEELRRHEIGQGFVATPPPSGPVRNVSEFERSEAVLVRYPLGIPLALVAALSEHVRVITLVAGPAQEAQAASAYTNAGVHMHNADFLHAPTNSIWTRDYGPFYVADAEGRIGVVDFVYNRPRPADDAVPAALAAHLGAPLYAMDVVHTGGNYMTDSRGTSASTDLVWEENGFDEERVMERMREYLGVHTYHVTMDPQHTYLKHIDTWAKFLDVDKVLIAEVPPSHPHYADHEAVADYFASQPSAYGTPYEVFRVYTPNGQPYTNALIVNERVYVPIVSSAWDQAALDVYAEALPGYEVLGFTGSWLSTDALHCRVKEVADRGMLSLQHVPLAGELPYAPEVALDVDIVAHSGEPLIEDGLFLIYRLGEAPFDTLALQHVDGATFSASVPVPPEGGEAAYYFSAADASGRTERFPLVGPAGARSFTVLPFPVESEGIANAGGLRLQAAYPNPSAGGVTVRYALDAAGPVRLEVLDLLGRRAALLHDGPAAAGPHRVRWPGGAAGTYIVRLTAFGAHAVRRVTLLR